MKSMASSILLRQFLEARIGLESFMKPMVHSWTRVRSA